jgi:large subunit ribosomal protein L25
MATTIELNAKRREGTGKGVARKLRAARRVPGILYGKGMEPVLIDLDEREFTKSVGGHAVSNLFVDLRVDGESALVKTLVREVQTNPLSGSVEHVDLNRISLTEEIEVEVPIELVGLATGVKNSGGILQHPIRSLAIKCLPQDLPDLITVDVSHLEIGDSVRVSELNLGNVTVLTDPETAVASVAPPTREEVAKPAEEAVAGAATPAEPELVDTKKKKPEDAGEAS